MKKRIVSILLVLALSLSLLPVAVLADPGSDAPATTPTTKSVTYLDETGAQQTTTATVLTASTTTWTSGWYVASGSVIIDDTVTATGDVHLILEDGADLTVNGQLEKDIDFEDWSGYGILISYEEKDDIVVPSSLTIYGQTGQTGKLTANGATSDLLNVVFSAGFAGALSGLTINGGQITAIGKKANRSHGVDVANFTLNGGTLTATSGAAVRHSCGVYTTDNITLNGGTLIAQGGNASNEENSERCYSYGLDSNVDNIQFNGGTLIAQCGTATKEAYAIDDQDLKLPSTPDYYWRTATTGDYIKSGEPTVTASYLELTTQPTGDNYLPYLTWNGTGLVPTVINKNTTTVTLLTSTAAATTLNNSAEYSAWYYVTGAVTIGGKLTVSGKVNLILCDGAALTTNGLEINENGALTIYAQSTGANAGSVTANSGISVTGSGSSLTITSGTLIAQSTGSGGAVTIAQGALNLPTAYFWRKASTAKYKTQATTPQTADLTGSYFELTTRSLPEAQLDRVAYLDWDSTTKQLKTTPSYREDATQITSATMSLDGNVGGGSERWYYVTDAVTIDRKLTVSGVVHLILCDGAELNVAGLDCSSAFLTIYGQTGQTGKLLSTSTDADGIQVGNTDRVQNGLLTVNGGSVTATGGTGKAGIRATYEGSKLTVNSGTLIAKSTGEGTAAVVLGQKTTFARPAAYYWRTSGADGTNYKTQKAYSADALSGNYFELTTTTQANVEPDPTITYLDENGDSKTCTDFTVIESSTTTLTGSENSNSSVWYVVKNSVTIDGELTVIGAVNLILCDGAALRVKGLVGEASLTIYAQSTGENAGKLVSTGSLTTTNSETISYGIYTRYLIINGGQIEATAAEGTEQTPVGRSCGVAAEGLLVTGGKLTATGGAAGSESDGIYAGKMYVNGGTVTGTGGAVTSNKASSNGIYAVMLSVNRQSLSSADPYDLDSDAETAPETPATPASPTQLKGEGGTVTGEGGLSTGIYATFMSVDGINFAELFTRTMETERDTASAPDGAQPAAPTTSAKVTAIGGTAANGESIGILASYYLHVGLSQEDLLGPVDPSALNEDDDQAATQPASSGSTADITATGNDIGILTSDTFTNALFHLPAVWLNGGKLTATGKSGIKVEQTLADAATLGLDALGLEPYEDGDSEDGDTNAFPTVYVQKGTLIADATGKQGIPDGLALNLGDRINDNAPLRCPTAYYWRTVKTAAYNQFPTSAYPYNWQHVYVEITTDKPATGGGDETDPPAPPTPPTPTPGSSALPQTYAITVLNAENGAAASSRRRSPSGLTITLSFTPDKGCALAQVRVTDASGKKIDLTRQADGSYTFTMPSADVEVKAVFMRLESPFVDVIPGQYFYESVLWAAANGITGGIDLTHFGPDSSCTRAQLVTFLWRAAGKNEVNFTLNFTDLDTNAYYIQALRWAASLDLISGYGDGKFGPDEAITREQMAVILFRFAKKMGFENANAGEDTNILSYSDALDISDYAFEAMQWAVGAGIMQGNAGNLMPKAPCTRAQIVTMLHRMLAK